MSEQIRRIFHREQKRKRAAFEIKEALFSFPKMSVKWSNSMQSFLVEGTMDVFDSEGNYWDSFELEIVLGSKFPFCVPKVRELSNKIPRIEDRHISTEGVFCLEMEHKLLLEARKGIDFKEFLLKHVYAYLSNQLYFESENEYLNGEWSHYGYGVLEYYRKELGLETGEEAVTAINLVLENNLPGRNDRCFCGRTKYKRCHEEAVKLLLVFGHKRLTIDLKEIQKLIAE